jgi:cysteine desulfurase/selenocysteine lyase
MQQIHDQEVILKKYLVSEFKKAKLGEKVQVYNLENSGPLFGFNVVGLNPQDVSAFLANDYLIATRSGAHCARTTENELGFKTSVRVSLGIYNTQKDVDQLILAFKNLDKVFDHLFN